MDLVYRFLSFDKLIGAQLVKLLYFIGLIGVAFGTLGVMFSGFGMGFIQGVGTMILGPVVGVLMLLYWRFICEIILLMFRISNDLADVKSLLSAQSTPTPAPSPPAASPAASSASG